MCQKGIFPALEIKNFLNHLFTVVKVLWQTFWLTKPKILDWAWCLRVERGGGVPSIASYWLNFQPVWKQNFATFGEVWPLFCRALKYTPFEVFL